MVAVIQRVLRASVKVDGAIVGECGHGLMILIGVAEGDTRTDADVLAAKISKLRIFCDENDKMNLSVMDTDRAILFISQFTLAADVYRGNRPSFDSAAEPAFAKSLYDEGIVILKDLGVDVQCGVFGAHMDIRYLNDGPITFLIDSKMLRSLK